MKHKSFTTLFLSAALLIGALTPFILLSKNEVVEVSAAQHKDNFDEYIYNGNYYDSITEEGEGLNGSLRQALSSYILPKAWPSYSGSSATSLAVLCQEADEDPSNKSNMIYLYTRDSVKKNAVSSWNREHTWPKSISGGCWGEGKAGSDLLHLRPTYNTVNSTRSSIPFGQTSSGEKKIYEGMEWGYIGSSDVTGSKVVMPLESARGDVARIIMYVWVAYKNYYSNLPDVTKVFDSYETILKWHMEDKPDELEGHRNDVSESSLQKNRNPFVDHPEYAWMIFGNEVSSATKEACREVYPGNSAKLTSISISSLPTKTEYYVSETLDTDGISVIGYYDDGTSKDVTSKCTFSPMVMPSSSCTQKITVTYGSKTTSFNVTVKDYEPVDLVGIKLSVTQEKIYENSQVQLKATYSPLNTYPYPTLSYSSSNVDVATINSNGLLSALTPGESTITVTATQGNIVKTDSLKIVVSEKDMPRIEDIYDMEKDATIEFYCQYLGSYPNQYKGIFVGDGDYATLIFGYSKKMTGLVPYKTYFKVSGKVDIFSGLYEVKEATIEIIDDVIGKAHVNPVTTYEFDGSEGVPEEGETAEEKVHDQRLILSRPCVIVGTVKSVSKTIEAGNDTSVTMTLSNGQEAIVFIKKNSDLDYSTLKTYLGTIGNQAVIKGYIGIYGTSFQLTVPTIVKQTDSYTATSFANDVISLTKDICANNGATSNKLLLIDVWTDLELNYYPQMKQAQRTIFANANGDQKGTEIEQGAARYDYIVAKYGLKNFANRDVEPLNLYYFDGVSLNNNSVLIVIIVISTISIMSVTTLLVLKKKRK